MTILLLSLSGCQKKEEEMTIPEAIGVLKHTLDQMMEEGEL